MMGKREVSMIDGDEYDFLTKARNFIICRSKEVKQAKRKFNKRVRKFVRKKINKEIEEYE